VQFFVGREDIVEQIEERCTRSLEDAEGGGATIGAMSLLQGPPGAGKSAILCGTTRRWEELGEKSPVTVKLWYNELNNEALVTGMIAETAR